VAATVVASKANTLTVIVPAGATSGVITVTNSHAIDYAFSAAPPDFALSIIRLTSELV
jgi:hypothetical protein